MSEIDAAKLKRLLIINEMKKNYFERSLLNGNVRSDIGQWLEGTRVVLKFVFAGESLHLFDEESKARRARWRRLCNGYMLWLHLCHL